MNKINWFPGHMAKTIREIKERINLVDAVIDIRDARIVYSSSIPNINKIINNKPRIILLNKCDLADDNVTNQFLKLLKNDNTISLEINALTGKGINNIKKSLEELLKHKLDKLKSKGILNYDLKVLVMGIPNVGKSSFINRVSKTSIAKVSDKPGVTRSLQWIKSSIGITMMDSPGLLWPNLEDETTGINLALTGAIKEEILDIEDLAYYLIKKLSNEYPNNLMARYNLENVESDIPYLIDNIGKKRGCLKSGGEIDYTRVSKIILDDFRSGKIGCISLEKPNKEVK